MRLPISSNKPRSSSLLGTPKSLKPRWPLMLRRVQGHSMMPVLPPGTSVIAWRWSRRLGSGQVIIFWHDGKEKIKRISRIDDGKLFVVGDHVEASTDSRDYGLIDQSQVLARVVWPRSGAKQPPA